MLVDHLVTHDDELTSKDRLRRHHFQYHHDEYSVDEKLPLQMDASATDVLYVVDGDDYKVSMFHWLLDEDNHRMSKIYVNESSLTTMNRMMMMGQDYCLLIM